MRDVGRSEKLIDKAMRTMQKLAREEPAKGDKVSGNQRILILSASMGTGHTRTAQALVCAFNEIGWAGQVRHEDALQYTNLGFANLYSQTYLDLVNNAPELLGWLYDYFDSPWKDENHRLAFEALNTRPLIKLLDQYDPHLVISTHFLPADILSWLTCRQRTTAQHAVVVTDFDVHAMWLCHHYSQFFVALRETKEHMCGLGFERDRIAVTGIPVHPKFALPKDKLAMRLKHGLERDLPVILVSAGGFGVGPMDHILQALSAITIQHQIVVVCGRNQQLKFDLEPGTKFGGAGSNMKAIGFTEDMDELMAAADLMVGKPGGLTAAEALVKGLVFVIVSPIPGQEERNADHLVERGAAIRCNNLPALAYKTEKLLGDRQRLERMQHNALTLSRPKAAIAVAEAAQQLLETPDRPLAVSPRTHVCLTKSERALKAAQEQVQQAAQNVVRGLRSNHEH
jgi:processive 1,2-diacylglycerol beta-glucosyltransferase